MKHITYTELVEGHGQEMAHALLRTLEQSSVIQNNVTFLDKGKRLEQALSAMNENIEPGEQHAH